MIVPEEIRKCAAFIAYQRDDGARPFVGTAFWVVRHIESLNGGFAYAVTAAHVIEGLRDHGVEEALIRVNFKGGGTGWVPALIRDWHFHPSDVANDVAVWRGGPAEIADVKVYRVDHFLLAEDFESQEVGIGTEVFLPGLFVNHAGGDKNEPIIRVGNLAAIPHDPVNTKRGRSAAFLIEARSIGGLSGSPVFANLGQLRARNGVVQTAPSPVFKLIGLMHGHFELETLAPDLVTDDDTAPRIHSGIGVVVPAKAILETITQPAIADAEALFIRENSP